MTPRERAARVIRARAAALRTQETWERDIAEAITAAVAEEREECALNIRLFAGSVDKVYPGDLDYKFRVLEQQIRDRGKSVPSAEEVTWEGINAPRVCG